MDFFMFVGVSRELFDLLVLICEATINHTHLNRYCGVPNENERIYDPRGVMAMTIKFLTSVAEPKDIYHQFRGAISNIFR